MIFSNSVRNIFFYWLAFISFAASIYHFSGIFFEIDDSPVWFHCIFVAVNILGIYGFLKRPKIYFYFFIFLIIQQYFYHGQDLTELWKAEQKIHWISLLTLLILPLGLVCLYDDLKLNKK